MLQFAPGKNKPTGRVLIFIRNVGKYTIHGFFREICYPVLTQTENTSSASRGFVLFIHVLRCRSMGKQNVTGDLIPSAKPGHPEIRPNKKALLRDHDDQ